MDSVEIADVICFIKARFLETSSALGSAAAPDKWLLPKKDTFLRNSSAPGSAAAPDKLLLQKKKNFWKKFCPRQRSCRTSGFFQQNRRISGKSSATGSAAAPDKWLNQKNLFFEKKFCPGQRSCPRQVACSKKQSDI